MEQRYVGRSGLQVSSLGLGTISWGRRTDEHEARELLTAFVGGGGTLVDTADSYAGGASEEILGSLLGDVVRREDLVIATKAGLRDGAPDASARSVLRALDRSLARLRTDHVDLWLVPGWDAHVPLEELLRALASAVDSGRALYAGVLTDSGWQLATAAVTARASGLPLVAAAVEHSLLGRGAEAEVLPAARHHGLGALVWAPLARGALTGKYRGTGGDPRGAGKPGGPKSATGAPAASASGTGGKTGSQGKSPAAGPSGSGSESVDAARAAAAAVGGGSVAPYLGRAHRQVVEAVVTAAEGLGVLPLEVALAWARDTPGVCSTIVGARTADQVEQVLYADDLELPVEIRAALDDVSRTGA